MSQLISLQGIDRELMLETCESLIAYCAGTVCVPLRSWIDLIEKQHRDRKTLGAATTENWIPPAAEVDANFRLACELVIRASITRMRLYLENDKTVGVLVSHIQDRIVEEYSSFTILVGNTNSGSAPAIVTDVELKDFLHGLCDETLGRSFSCYSTLYSGRNAVRHDAQIVKADR